MKHFGKCYKHGLVKDLKETTAVEGSDFVEAKKGFTEEVTFNISLYEYKGVFRYQRVGCSQMHGGKN